MYYHATLVPCRFDPIRSRIQPFSYVVFFLSFFNLILGGETLWTIWSGNAERERERKKSRVEYLESKFPQIFAIRVPAFSRVVTPPILHSLSSVGLVTIARIDSSDGKLPTGLAWLEFLGAKMEIVSIFPFETGFLIWKGLLMGPVFQLSPPLIDWFVP